ncbi:MULTISPECIES: hypothetical protein [unclassified Ensifer]|uniref:hypothetical protein n=1 Tax=unclassified Ensifer TaxID=2633371 RepID=UPI000812FDEC|nr:MULTISPECIES: hypothetical protein [unclassified Ensifer]OCP01100.1 hypothetical protein BC362_21825 [Ensifer sp. LC14]OCP05363.1 hypothetical protein BBX50_24035 [Ensifer sp. LC11]OCP05974.1 hypothetical protein BC374_24255 [Ensifer sp. LC13]OCP30797.1 hypothetical protein BC364_23885 [Ensifer sp. LC499]
MTKKRATPMSPHERQAYDHARNGIRLGTEAKYTEAVEAWRLASDIADAHLAFTDMYYWIKSGYGAALCDAGRYRESIAVSMLSRELTLERRQPLSSLSIARSFLALAEGEAAAPHLRDVHNLIGDAIFEQFDQDLEADVHAAIAGLENGGTQPTVDRSK